MYNKSNLTKELFKTGFMCTYIKMEYLVANALVTLYEKKKITRVSFDDIRNYGIKVEEELINQNIHAILLYSNSYTKEFLEDYSEWFERDGDGIKMRAGKTVDQIRNHILSYASLDMLLALIKETTLQVISTFRAGN